MVSDPVALNVAELDEYLEKFMPYVKKIYTGNSIASDNVNSFTSAISDTIKAKGTSLARLVRTT